MYISNESKYLMTQTLLFIMLLLQTKVVFTKREDFLKDTRISPVAIIIFSCIPNEELYDPSIYK